MKRLTPSEVALRLAVPWSENTLAHSNIIASGRDTGRVIAGEILEAAIQWHDHVLLFVTDGIPLEDGLNIYLFDARWTLMDSVRLGAMYATGAFSSLEFSPPNHLRFQFIGGITWTLELLDRPVAALPFCDPTGRLPAIPPLQTLQDRWPSAP